MTRRLVLSSLFLLMAAMVALDSSAKTAEAAERGQPSDMQRFYHYPYVYYPQTYERPRQYNNMYHRYPQSMRIPVYNKNWYNFYPTARPYHSGHHYILDVF